LLGIEQMDELVEQASLANAGLSRNGNDLSVACFDLVQGLAEHGEFGMPPDEWSQPTCHHLQARPGPCSDHLKHLDRLCHSLNRHGAQGLGVDKSLCEPQRLRHQQDGPGNSQLLRSGGKMRGQPDHGVVRVQIATNRPNDDLTGVQSDTDLNRNAIGPQDSVYILADRLLHPKRRVARPHRVVLVGDRRPEQRHDPVAHDLVHGALVAVDRLYHALEDRIQELAGFLGISIRQQLHGSFEVGKQHRDLFRSPSRADFELRMRSARCLGV
jgi:hypothetical protein